MTAFAALAASLPTRGVRLGPMRITVYGACAAAGVLLAMALSGRAARRTGLDPEAAWDAGLFAILSCFATSRLLLVLSDPKAFAHFPLLVLGLPSLTIGGIALAGAAAAVYLWRKRLPWQRMLDAFAPPGALLAGFLELGHLLDGTEPGMPMGFSRALPAASHDMLRFYPVSLFGLVLALILALVLFRMLLRRWAPGKTAAAGLMLGGFSAALLDMISLPADVFSSWWLEPGQLVTLAAMAAGALLWTLVPPENEAVLTRNKGEHATQLWQPAE